MAYHFVLCHNTADASSSNLKCWPFYLMHLQGAFDVSHCAGPGGAHAIKGYVSTIKAGSRTNQAIHFPFYKTGTRASVLFLTASSTKCKSDLISKTLAAAGAARTQICHAPNFLLGHPRAAHEFFTPRVSDSKA
jgi:hypothetical protein